MKLFFFGCDTQPGHYMFAVIEGWLGSLRRSDQQLPRSIQPETIDAAYTPRHDRRQGAAALNEIDGYTILSWHDYSIDGRPNCNANLIAEGSHNFAAMVQILERYVPTVATRQPSPVYLAVDTNKPLQP